MSAARPTKQTGLVTPRATDIARPSKKFRLNRDRLKESHLVAYGLEKTEVDKTTSQIIGVRCMFCVCFGNESSTDSKRKRKATENTMYWKDTGNGIRSDRFLSHHRTAHPEAFAKYQALNEAEKKAFFEDNAPVKSTLWEYVVGKKDRVVFQIQRDIVEVIIGQLLYDCEGDGDGDGDEDKSIAASQERALQCFMKISNVSESGDEDTKDDDDDDDAGSYIASIKNPKQFQLVIGLLGTGASFRAVVQSIKCMIETLETSLVHSVSEKDVQRFARIACAVSLNKIRDILDHVWCFSVALDMSNHQSTGYFDIRVRVFVAGKLHNLHVMALPVFTRHTALNLFRAFQRLFDVLCPAWRDKILSCSTDGENKMTGKQNGFLKLLSDEAKSHLIRTWCGAHQLDLKMGKFYTSMYDGKWYSAFAHQIGYFRQQQNLCNELNSRCPKVCLTRWLSMFGATEYFVKNKIALYNFQEQADNKPSMGSSFWLAVFFVHRVAYLSKITYQQIQGKRVTLEQQEYYISELVTSLRSEFEIEIVHRGINEDISSDVDCNSDEDSVTKWGSFIYLRDEESDVRLRMKPGSLTNWLRKSTTSWTRKLLQDMEEENETSDDDAVFEFMEGLCHLLMSLVRDIISITVERDDNNTAGDSDLPTLPLTLNELSNEGFMTLVDFQLERYLTKHEEADRDFLETEYLDLKKKLEDKKLLTYLENRAKESDYDFEKAWKPIAKDYPRLYDFCGSLATIFPGTATVEADFSGLKWSKDAHSFSLSDFSLEAKLQAKQWKEIQAI